MIEEYQEMAEVKSKSWRKERNFTDVTTGDLSANPLHARLVSLVCFALNSSEFGFVNKISA